LESGGVRGRQIERINFTADISKNSEIEGNLAKNFELPMACRCNEITELIGTDAEDYARAHFVEGETVDGGWSTGYVCPLTGQQWVLDRLHGERQGGGWSRLRKRLDVDEIIKHVKHRIPTVTVSQLHVSHPGVDDDGLWYFELPGIGQNIQIESSSGQCPFIIEHSGMNSSSEAINGASISEVVEAVVSYLSLIRNE
jgi:hypothetical protein